MSGFTKEERAAMRARAKELKTRTDGEQAIKDAIAAMEPGERKLAQRMHELITAAAPDLTPKTWYGMPAYADADGKVVVFYRNASKFKERYAMLGFQDNANLDDGTMWPVAYAVSKLTPADEKKVTKLVKQAVKS